MSRVEMQFRGADPACRVSGDHVLPAKVNYLVGRNRSAWRTDIPTYQKVTYESVYPGINLVFYGTREGFEYDFIISPGANPAEIDLAFNGADRIGLDTHGNLLLGIGAGQLLQSKPLIYQDTGGIRRIVEGRYVLKDQNRVGIEVAAYDPGKALVIDPVIDFSTFFGGSSDDTFGDMALDDDGNILMVGATMSADFPLAFESWHDALSGSSDIFISKLDPSGTTLLSSTYFGGTGDEGGLPQIAVDGEGNLYVTGETWSTDFPVSDWAFQKVRADSSASFVAKLNSTATELIYATLLDATASVSDYLNTIVIKDLAVDAAGHAFVTGYTNSTKFPTTDGALKEFLGGNGYCGVGMCNDAFVTKFDLTGSSLVYSTYLGDSNPGGSGAWGQNDRAFAIAVDDNGSAYVTGNTNGAAYPTTAGAYQTVFMGGGMFGEYGDAFISKLNAEGTSLVYSTFLGGSMVPADGIGGVDMGFDIAVDRAGSAYVTGSTSAKNFPVTLTAVQPELNFGGAHCAAAMTSDFVPCPDAFVAKLDAAGAELLYATYLGGLDYDNGKSIAVDAAGVIHVAGGTDSSDFPLTEDAWQTTPLGGGSCGTMDACSDAFVAKLSTIGTEIIYSTYLGGSGGETERGIEISPDNRGDFYVSGDTQSVDFPLLSPYQSTTAARDLFVAKFGDLTVLNDDTEFVKQLYRDFLNREAEPVGLASWAAQLIAGSVTRPQLAELFINSDEFQGKIAPIVRLYISYFLRAPDYGGLMYWVNNFALGMSLNQISDEFAKSPEFISMYGSKTNEEFVTLMYENVYGRTPNGGEVSYWANFINDGLLTRGQVMVYFSDSEEYRQKSYNRVYVIMAYVGMVRRSPYPDDIGGYEFWVWGMDQGVSGLSLIEAFLESEEYAARFLVTSAAEVPGYVGDYFPFDDGRIWVYQGTDKVSGGDVAYDNIMSIHGTKVVDGLKATVFKETNPDNLGESLEYYLYKDNHGISFLGSADPSDILMAQLVPYQEVESPVQIGDSFVQVNESGLDYGEDLDGDGKNEQVDVFSEVKVIGLETITVPAGTFTDSAKLRSDVTLDIRLSKSKSWITATDVMRYWYAPGVGRVKYTSKLTIDGDSETVIEELTGYFSLLAEDIAPADSDTEYPGKPSVGFDGTNFLAVSREVVSQTDSVMIGMIVNHAGKVLKRFEIAEGDTGGSLSSNRSAVAFDGENYLVVFGKNGQIVGQRVTPAGEILDGSYGFVIASSGSNYFPAVDFDGTNFLVVWAKFTSGYDIYGVLVSPQGDVHDEFAVFAADGEQVTPSISFNGSNYLVAWRDTRWDGVKNVMDIYAMRVSPAGTPLDPSGIPLCIAAGDQEAPALSSDGNGYFAVWSDGRVYAGENGQIPGMDIYGARVAANGDILDPAGIPINTVSYMAFNGKANPTIAFDGEGYFVAWQTGSFPNYPPAGIFANWVTTSGEVLNGSVGEDGMSMSGLPAATAKYVYPVAGPGKDSIFLAWVNLIELSGASKDVYGTIVTR